MYAQCLADLFNLQLWPTGRPTSYSDIRDGLEELTSAVLQCVAGQNEVTIRLYGGWHGEVPETRVEVREMVLRAIDRTPKRIGRTRVRFQLAETPMWDRSLRLLRSVKVVRPSHLRLKLSQSRNCANPTQCSLLHMIDWAKGRCSSPGCTVRLREVAVDHGQKMVDTLLTADALHIATCNDSQAVVIASDDEDMIPALLFLARANLDVVHLVRRPGSPSDYYRGILELRGVTIQEW